MKWSTVKDKNVNRQINDKAAQTSLKRYLIRFNPDVMKIKIYEVEDLFSTFITLIPVGPWKEILNFTHK